MAKMRIYELAKELGESNPELDSKTLNADILKFLQENGSEAKSASSGISDEEIELVRSRFASKSSKSGKSSQKDSSASKKDKEGDKAKAESKAEPKAETKEAGTPEVKTEPSPKKEEQDRKESESADKRSGDSAGKVRKGKLRGKNGTVIIYRVDENSGRLINDDDNTMLPLVMGTDGNIYRLDGTPLAKSGSKDSQHRPAQPQPMNQVFDGRSAKDRKNAATSSNNRNSNNNAGNNAGSNKTHSKGGLTDALGEKMKAFESQLDPDNENYVPEKKEKKKKVYDLPEIPSKNKNGSGTEDITETDTGVKETPAAETVQSTNVEETVKTAKSGAEQASGRPDPGAREFQDRSGQRKPQDQRGSQDRGERSFNRDSNGQNQRNRDNRSFDGRSFDGKNQGGRDQNSFDGRNQGRSGDQRGNDRGRFQDRDSRNQGGRDGFKTGDPSMRGKGTKPFGDRNQNAPDKDSDQRRPFNRKNDGRNSGGSIKSELANELGKNNRAENLKDRNRDKSRRDRGRDYDEDGLKNAKNKKDPNRKGAFQKPVAKPQMKEDDIKTITVPEVITIKELADKMKQNSSAIIKKLFMGGKMVNVNSEITFEEAEEIALEYEIICEKEVKVNMIEELLKESEEDPDTLVTRPPVVCVMGHVDHGKTSLLDAIRKTNVTAREAGGITQHIGAYMVEISGRKITFLDTPGHEAFTSMRMRGAKSTDIAILVVAADDGVMPQTVEAINHAKAANVSIIVAVNKIDKPGANIDRVKQELTEHGLVAEDWGGDTVFVPVSAKTGEGIENLLEMVLLTADVLELKANPNRRARGIVIEAQLDKGRGPVATVLIQKGTLNVGDNVAIGAAHGKVRAMIDDNGRKVKTATPSTPVEILGLNGVPQAGEVILAVADEKEARTIAEAFIAQSKEQLIAETKARLSLDGLFSQIQAGEVKELNIIIKADVMGSVEAVKQSLLKLSNEEVVVRVIHGGVGNINESDVTLASASNAIIIGFNVKPDNTAKDIAEHEGIDVKLYKVIYDAINDVEAAMKGMLKPVYEEKVIGHAEIRQLFKASGVGVIAGSYVLDGKIVRGCKARISRNDELIFEGNLASLKRFKDDVKEVAAGYECGLVFEKFSDLAELDQAEFYVMEEVPRK
ncbi:MAG: translation initiation factor IF-2 [Lachnospiraceae bacterium]|nr:translation initiation factor IF-2 [Lachnospiraceae bacterium]